MATGYRGTFVISWAQTEVDGQASAPARALVAGAVWRWHGAAVRVDGPDRPLVLTGAEEVEALRRHAARAVVRLVGRALPARRADNGAGAEEASEEPLFDRGFAVTDGRRRWTATLIELPGASPLVMFLGEIPPAGRELWVSGLMLSGGRRRRVPAEPPAVICFTPETMIATPEGPLPVALVQEGDLVLTRDDGPQPVLWIGRRRVSGARLQAQPELRPVRLRAGALNDLPKGIGQGGDLPDRDLLVSPDHRILLKGSRARALFNEDEVLVRARDLIDDRRIIVDRTGREVTYVHLLLERHQIVWANGVQSETFHPSAMPLSAIDEAQRAELLARMPGLGDDPDAYGAFARRALGAAEAAIMLHGRRATRGVDGWVGGERLS
ncbi:MAG: hemolysin-type calcium-binding protein [Alphaproteobacteria bacterium]|nr:MAG: hemolysin-type calcium-binding protein [Alphaproteobacteria bacterium]